MTKQAAKKVQRIKLNGYNVMRFEEINGEIYVGPKELQNSIKCLVPELQKRIEKVFYK
jgi:very-short-patch-repair endonuclease